MTSATSPRSWLPSGSVAWGCALPASITTVARRTSTACTVSGLGSRRWPAGWRRSRRPATSHPTPVEVGAFANAVLQHGNSRIRLCAFSGRRSRRGLAALLAHSLGEDPHGDDGKDAEADHEPEQMAVTRR